MVICGFLVYKFYEISRSSTESSMDLAEIPGISDLPRINGDKLKPDKRIDDGSFGEIWKVGIGGGESGGEKSQVRAALHLSQELLSGRIDIVAFARDSDLRTTERQEVQTRSESDRNLSRPDFPISSPFRWRWNQTVVSSPSLCYCLFSLQWEFGGISERQEQSDSSADSPADPARYQSGISRLDQSQHPASGPGLSERSDR